MKKYIKGITTLILAGVLVLGCEDDLKLSDYQSSGDPECLASVGELTVGANKGVVLFCGIINSGKFLQQGVAISESPIEDITSASVKVVYAKNNKTEAQELYFSGLVPDTEYYVCSFVVNSRGIAMGEEQKVKTIDVDYEVLFDESIFLDDDDELLAGWGLIAGGEGNTIEVWPGAFNSGAADAIESLINEGFNLIALPVVDFQLIAELSFYAHMYDGGPDYVTVVASEQPLTKENIGQATVIKEMTISKNGTVSTLIEGFEKDKDCHIGIMHHGSAEMLFTFIKLTMISEK